MCTIVLGKFILDKGGKMSFMSCSRNRLQIFPIFWSRVRPGTVSVPSVGTDTLRVQVGIYGSSKSKGTPMGPHSSVRPKENRTFNVNGNI